MGRPGANELFPEQTLEHTRTHLSIHAVMSLIQAEIGVNLAKIEKKITQNTYLTG